MGIDYRYRYTMVHLITTYYIQDLPKRLHFIKLNLLYQNREEE